MEPKEEIKQRLPIEVVIGEYIELKRAGRNYKGLSPFSAEKTPSFIVSPEKNIWHDFSSGKGGDIFSFVMQVEGLEFPEALKNLATKAGVELPEYNAGAKTATKLKKRLYEVNKMATKYFQTSLLKNPEALNYLKERGITKQAIKDFELGYAPNSPQGLVKLLQKHNFTVDEIQKAGVASNRQGGLYDIFRERITFPFVSPKGEHLGFTGRAIKDTTFGPKYLNTPATLIYNKSDFLYGLNLAKESIRTKNQVVLLEGNFDVVNSYQAGLQEVVAASGTAITPLQLRQLQRFTDNLIFCLDTDKAGINATIRSLEVSASTDLKVFVATIPENYKDPDELIQAEGLQAWELAVQSRQDAYIWMIETLAKQIDLSSPAQKGSYANQCQGILNLIKNPVAKEGYQRYLAEKLQVSIEALDQLATTASTKKTLKKAKLDPKKPKELEKLQSKFNNSLDLNLSLLLGLDPESRTQELGKLQKLLGPSEVSREEPKALYQSLIEAKKIKSTPYTDELELIREQLFEFAPDDQNTVSMLQEQLGLLARSIKDLKLFKLKHLLQNADPKEQPNILQQIHELQSEEKAVQNSTTPES